MTTPLVLPLSDQSVDIASAGGKGASLARLAGAGLPVPRGFVVTTRAYRDFVAGDGLQAAIVRAVSEHSPAEAARLVADLFARHDMPPQIPAAVRDAYEALGAASGDADVAVAVRSSATAEDLPEASFAGQLDSYLNIRGDGLAAAIKRCWASLWTERAIAYRAHNGVPHDEVAIAVVVQRLVPAEAAGVMFTADPMHQGRLVINAAWGLGEAVVGGRVTPDAITVDRAGRTVVTTEVGDKRTMTIRVPGGGVRDEPVPADKRRLAVLDHADAGRLARLGIQIEELYGRAMDIEWAREGDDLVILQARPVTGAAEEWNATTSGTYLWTKGNLGEAIPDVMTPATWSIVELNMDDAMAGSGIPGYPMIGNIGGRFYMNLSVVASIVLAFGRKRRLAQLQDAFGRFPDDIPLLPLTRGQLLRKVLPVGFRLVKRMRANIKRLPAYLATVPERTEAVRHKAATARSPQQLLELWQHELEPLFRESGQMLQAAGREGGGATILVVRDELRKLVGETDAETLISGVGQDGDLASLGPMTALDQLARGEIDRESFARNYGHRGPHEFEISAPRPGEDPTWIDQQLADRADRGTDTDPLTRQRHDRHEAWTRLRERHPKREPAMRKKVAVVQRIVRNREAARSEMMRVYWAIRTFVERAGSLTGHGPDLYFLTIHEILEVLGGSATPLAKVPARRAAYERYKALPPYPNLIIGRFDPVRWAAEPHRRTDVYDARGGTTPPADTVRGFPGAPGVVEGTARLIHTPEDGNRLGQGEILVTTVTNIGWTPIFPKAAAVVTDVGAPLSHTAIVARELGIPAVVGTGNATMHLKDGERIRVDGEHGTVEVIDQPGP